MLMGMFIKCHSGFETDGGTDSFLHTMLSSKTHSVAPYPEQSRPALGRAFVWSDYGVVFSRLDLIRLPGEWLEG